MTRFRTLAWAAAVCTYLLIVLGAVVRITGSGLGCGDHWPLCNGHLFPPLNDIGTVIEWSHRLVAALVSILVTALAVSAWRARMPGRGPYAEFGLLVVQILLGAITVKLELPAWSVVLHLGTAMLLLATLLGIATARAVPLSPLVLLAFITVLFGALTANLGAAAACGGFPRGTGQIWNTAGPLAVIQWIHRLLAYSLAIAVTVWAVRTAGRGPRLLLGLVVLQIGVGAATVLLGLPRGLQAAHVAVGAAVWVAVVLATKRPQTTAPGPFATGTARSPTDS
jgi:cytochrome c oxidase assembly protein subunit 15